MKSLYKVEHQLKLLEMQAEIEFILQQLQNLKVPPDTATPASSNDSNVANQALTSQLN